METSGKIAVITGRAAASVVQPRSRCSRTDFRWCWLSAVATKLVRDPIDGAGGPGGEIFIVRFDDVHLKGERQHAVRFPSGVVLIA